MPSRFCAHVAVALTTIALFACGGERGGLDAAHDAWTEAAPVDASRVDAAMDVATRCFMVSPPATCGDGVCDPGCEDPLGCPADCPLPDGGLGCGDASSVWACNANGTARYECHHGLYAIEVCGAPGTCQTIGGGWPAQCHACTPCNGWNNASPAIGQPFVWSCTSGGAERARCVDTHTLHDCVMGQSDPANCCVLDDTCVGGGCVGTPLGSEDYCPM